MSASAASEKTPAGRNAALRDNRLRRGLRAASTTLFGWLAGSVALVAFGLDSMIEVISAGILYVRLRAEVRGADPRREAENRAAR